MTVSPSALERDKSDKEIAQNGRSRNEGYRIQQHNFKQVPPLFFTQDNHPLFIGDVYRGRSAFLICGGPSFGALDHTMLRAPGVLTMGLNNSVKTFRPNLWCSVDSPDHWVRSVWLDPTITKFVPTGHHDKRIFNSDKWEHMRLKVGDCPNVIYFRRNEHFQARQWLWEDCFNWGNHSKVGGGRSVMLPAVRILFELGIRRIYLLGADFTMSAETKYHFDQNRHVGSIKGNNSTYEKMNGWFKELRPLFEQQKFHVFNCNPQSNLKAFEFIDYKDALEEAHSHMDFVDVAAERTRNLYDTDTREKEEGIGKSTNWMRFNTPNGVRRCRFCGKKCCKPSGDMKFPGKIQLTAGCEHSRRKLWVHRDGKYHGNLNQVGTDLLPQEEAVADWNRRFGKEEKK
jgi:hypothetical protein